MEEHISAVRIGP